MSRRIEETFTRLKAQKRAALIPFIMAGDPDMQNAQAVLDALPAAGADLIEIGMPFSDPMADGKAIQAAGLRSLKAGTTTACILKMVAQFRTRQPDVPIILMGYFNPIYRYGCEKFCADAAEAGADGLILVDLPPEEEDEMRPALSTSGLKLIRLIAPTSADMAGRLERLTASASGFVYYIAVAGITGGKSADADTLAKAVKELKQHTALPVAVGFGIRTAAQVREVAGFADAVVVGSALVEVIARDKNPAAAATAFVSELAAGLKD